MFDTGIITYNNMMTAAVLSKNQLPVQNKRLFQTDYTKSKAFILKTALQEWFKHYLILSFTLKLRHRFTKVQTQWMLVIICDCTAFNNEENHPVDLAIKGHHMKKTIKQLPG